MTVGALEAVSHTSHIPRDCAASPRLDQAASNSSFVCVDVHQVIEHTVEVLLVKALVSYDSVYGNTEKIANAASTAISPYGGIRALRAGDADLSESESGDCT